MEVLLQGVWILIILVSAAAAQNCAYPSVQLFFTYDALSCGKSQWITYIFGPQTITTTMFPKYVLTRAITANLVFTGKIQHLQKDEGNPRGTSFRAVVEVDCFYKGSTPQSTITLIDFDPSEKNGLCTSIILGENKRGLFYTTAINATHARINERGFIGDQESNNEKTASEYLRCDKNKGPINLIKPTGSSSTTCQWMETCKSQLDYSSAVKMLEHSYTKYESSLKAGCRNLGKDKLLPSLQMNAAIFTDTQTNKPGAAHGKQASHFSKSGSPLAISLFIYLAVSTNLLILS